jgi:hypothetical protein
MYAHSQNVRKLVATSEDEESLLQQLKELPRSVRTPAAFKAFEKAIRQDLGHL